MNFKCASAVVNQIYNSDRGAQYITFVSLINGSMFKIAFAGQKTDLKEGDMVSIDISVKGRLNQQGGMNLTFESGQINKAQKG
jgi:methionine aminopeptidase